MFSQFMLGGTASICNIEIHSLAMTVVIQVARLKSTGWRADVHRLIVDEWGDEIVNINAQMFYCPMMRGSVAAGSIE